MKLINETLNKAVITTSYVLSDKSVITYISYDEDGDWQFFGNEEVSEIDARVISVEQVLQLDESLKTLPDMEIGQSASRASVNADWVVK